MYEELYHLQAKPFRLSPDPEFFFASRGHKRALAYLRYGLNQSEGFVVITGDPGTGKTTLAQILLQELGQTDIVVAHLTTTQLEADDMLRMVVASYGLRYEGVDKAGLLKTLEAFLLARSREHKRALLVVDEAQNLPPRSVEELRMLSNLQVGGQALLQIFMLGQAQFRQMLDRPDLEQLRQRVISNYHLSALAADECKSYVESRLTRVGWRDDPHITDEAYDVIFNYTAGIPRRINMLCDRVLLFSCLEDGHVIDENVLREVTDELQSETSGRPIQPAEAEGSAVDTHHESAVMNPEILEVIEELEVQISETSTISSSSMKTRETAELSLKPAAKSPGDSQVGKTSDGNWNQSVAHARQDPVEDEPEAEDEVPSAEAAEKLLDKERFRVITGGKKAPDQKAKPPYVSGTEYTAPIPDANGDSEEVVLRKVLRLVLAFHRSPRSFPGLDDPSQPLPKGLRAIMTLAVSDDDTIKNLRQIAVMGISPPMLRAAVRFFIRRVLLVANADDYRILGLVPNASMPDIEAHYGLIMHLLRQENPNEDDSSITLVGAAYEQLCRSELSPGAYEPTKITPKTSIDDDALDLDLSPGAGAGAGMDRTTTRRITPNTFGAIPDTRNVDLPRKGSSGGRITLLLAALVAAAGFYLSGIFGFDSDVGVIERWGQKAERVGQALPIPAEEVVVKSEANVSAPESLLSEESAPNAVVEPEIDIEPEQDAGIGSQNILDKSVVDIRGDSGLTDSEKFHLGVNQNMESTGLVENNSSDQKTMLEPSVNQTMFLEFQTRAEEATLAQQRAEAEAAARTEELASLKQVEQERLAEEVRDRKAAEESAKVKARELQELKAELQRSAQARALAEAQASLEAKARAEAELRAAQEAEINARRVEDARVAEQRRFEAEQRVQQAKELARQQALQQQFLQQQEAEARSQAAIEEEKQLAESAAEAGVLNAIAVEEVAQIRSAEDAGKISQSDLQGILQTFEAVYSNGNTEGLIDILSDNVRTNDIAARNEIRASYQTVFNGTVSRDIKFKDVVWEREDDYARGKGTYEFNARIEGQQQDITGQGEVVLEFERQLGELQITRFYFSDSVPDQSILNIANKQISLNALNDLTGKFVGAYETGNIELFMSLFTPDALSDGLGVQAIRQDYAELFANTTLREMNLRKMKWQWVDGGLAQGQSEYDVEVQFKGSNDLKLVHGNLWIHAQEWNGVPRIKELGFQE